MAEGDEGMKVGDMDPLRGGRAPDQRQQRLGRWGTGTRTETGVAADSMATTGGSSQAEAPGEWSDSGEVGVCAGDQGDRGVQ